MLARPGNLGTPAFMSTAIQILKNLCFPWLYDCHELSALELKFQVFFYFPMLALKHRVQNTHGRDGKVNLSSLFWVQKGVISKSGRFHHLKSQRCMESLWKTPSLTSLLKRIPFLRAMHSLLDFKCVSFPIWQCSFSKQTVNLLMEVRAAHQPGLHRM